MVELCNRLDGQYDLLEDFQQLDLLAYGVVDQTNEVYAYSKQEVDLDGEPVTFPIVFRTWRPEYLYVEEGWRVVNEKNADPEQEGSDTSK